MDRIADSFIGRILLRLTKYSMRIMGAVMVVAALTMMLSGVAFFFYAMLPLLSSPPSIMFIINFSLGIFVSFNLLFNFVQCVRVNPGNPPEEWVSNLL